MNLDEFRRQMVSYRQAVTEEAKLLKDSYHVIDRLRALYQKCDDEERKLANQVLAEWVLSDDEDVRYDAQLLINEFQIMTAAPALRELAVRLESSNMLGAPYELEIVNRIIRGISLKSE